jgi:hypothetical protein
MADDTGRVTQDDIASLTRHLDEWGASLEPKERALLDLIVARGRVVEPDDVYRAQIQQGIDRAVLQTFRDVSSAWQMDDVWMKVGPVWEKANRVEIGEEVELETRFTYRRR